MVPFGKIIAETTEKGSGAFGVGKATGMQMKIGLIGMGNIGMFLAKNLRQEIIWVCDVRKAGARKRLGGLGIKAEVVAKPKPGVGLVVEAASQEAVEMLVPALKFADVLILSVGALRDEKLLAQLKKAAERGGHKIYVPSGAIGGIDAIKSARPELQSVVLEMRKPPASLGRRDKKETVVFFGPAGRACEKFPKNVNVSATLSLAGLGFARTKVRVVSDPKLKVNQHRIIARGKAGEMEFVFRNKPMAGNPATSKLAALAALRMIKERKEVLVLG